MKSMCVRAVLVCLLLLSCSGFSWSAPGKQQPKTSAAESKVVDKVSVKATGMPITALLASIAKQADKKLVVETNVTGNLDLTLEKVEFEQALGAICAAAKLQWREVYLAADSEYLTQPDKLASVVRLATGIGLPDVVVSKSSVGKAGLYTSEKTAVETAQKAVIEQLKLQPVYVVTNDSGVSLATGNQSKIDEYSSLVKKQMDMLMNMSADDLEKALMASLDLSQQMDPRYIANIMSALMRTDQVALRRAVARQNEMIFSMSSEDRRAMIKLGMQLQTTLTPEQIQTIQDDTKAVLEDLQSEKGQ